MKIRVRSILFSGLSAIGLVGFCGTVGMVAPPNEAVSAATQDIGSNAKLQTPPLVALGKSLQSVEPEAITKLMLSVNKNGVSRIRYNGFMRRAIVESFANQTVPNQAALPKLTVSSSRDVLAALTEDQVRQVLIAKVKSMLGATPPKDLKQRRAAQNTIAAKYPRSKTARVGVGANLVNAPTPQDSQLDWRDKGLIVQDSGIVTAVKNQGTCGCCWAFATVAAVESAYARVNLDLIDASEQYVLNCATTELSAQTGQTYSCNGGWWAFDMLVVGNSLNGVSPGLPKEADLPYAGQQGNFSSGLTLPYQLQTWGYVAGTSDQSDIPSDDNLKSALCEYGPIAVGIMVPTDQNGNTLITWAGSNGNPIDDFTNDLSQSINHAVLLVGWDNTVGQNGAWIIKNSWGEWGIPDASTDVGSGFGYVEFGHNNVGLGAAWVLPTPLPVGN
jgi:C1A family cysteine protease